jgi:MinD-like ATPase involved in chromosome partitioning or flagellar assembly
MEQMTPELYGQLIAFLGRFYELILLDLGTGLTEPLARFALERADHAVMVATPSGSPRARSSTPSNTSAGASAPAN